MYWLHYILRPVYRNAAQMRESTPLLLPQHGGDRGCRLTVLYVTIMALIGLLVFSSAFTVFLLFRATVRIPSSSNLNHFIKSTSPNDPRFERSDRSPITVHVLDASIGQPARGVPIELTLWDPIRSVWMPYQLNSTVLTNQDGRVNDLIVSLPEQGGLFKMTFRTEAYFKAVGVTQYFYPFVEVVFRIVDTTSHYHIPLLFSPFSYSTYRGS